ncbi:MAG TPA: NBR1-Ig-like domain-containing protein [Anaerolineales bacterium]
MHRMPGRIALCCLLALAACSPAATAPPFIPPAAPPLPSETSAPTPTQIPLPSVSASPSPPPSSPSPPPTTVACANDLTYLADLSVPDPSVIPAGGRIEKKWLVQNTGTCDWTRDYRLKLTSGDAFGALAEQALFPARAGTQAVLAVICTAPLEAGTYTSVWQAFSPDGTAFGQTVYMTIIVSP